MSFMDSMIRGFTLSGMDAIARAGYADSKMFADIINAAVNTFPGLVHTARQVMKVGSTRRRWPNLCGGSRLR